MLKILYANVGTEWSERLLQNYLQELPEEMVLKSMRFRRWEDRQTYIGGKLLLIKGLEAFYQPKSRLLEIQYNEFDRPSLSGSIDFNITHSGKYVCCALSNEFGLGIDIEEVNSIELKDFDYIWTEKERSLIANSDDEYRSFFWLWTAKEAVIKADGRGLNIPLKEIEITEKGSQVGPNYWHLTLLPMPDNYIGHLATEVALSAPIKMENILL